MKKLIQNTSDVVKIKKLLLNDYSSKLKAATGQMLALKARGRDIPSDLIEKIKDLKSRVDFWQYEVERFSFIAAQQKELTQIR